MAFRLLRKLGSLFSLAALERYWRWGWRLLLVALLIDIGYLYGIWPDWELYRQGPLQQSSFIQAYRTEQARRDDWPRLRWNPTPLAQIPHVMQRAVVAAEDSRFWQHGGIDWQALREAMQHNYEQRRLVYGASTISQQTVKNRFLTASRDPLRKWHEAWLTLGMEQNLSKRRILEHYLNIAEFGRGVYGVDAAARFYYGIPASRLQGWQAIELAASLPSPVANNPQTRTRAFLRRVNRIRRYF